ncbi:MAG TPA: HNH endonuclease signature motif containing protein [Candidatus Binatia bacterium]|nr:HNH endonuclease signature motif containing protein [Candidatus Binatia bacterium]
MKFWAGVTDNRWWEFLSTRGVDEVNFWQPSPKPLFKTLPAGTPFLFKLRRPNNHIAGGGFFVKYSRLPLPVAWEAFREKNGAASLQELEQLIRPLAPDSRSPTLEIGCTVLNSPFFFARNEWIPCPQSWGASIMRGKTYDTQESGGRELWEAVQARLRSSPAVAAEPDPAAYAPAQYGQPYLSRSRLGQGAFRVLVTEAYKKRCAITGESTLPVLEAAHIQPFSQAGANHPRNGLLLRSDFHKLFDLGLVSVSPEMKVKVSPRIRDQWFNGKAYYRLDGQPLAVMPDDPGDHPDPALLRWHSTERFAA